jgi:iron complex transport system substrate-binding protein
LSIAVLWFAVVFRNTACSRSQTPTSQAADSNPAASTNDQVAASSNQSPLRIVTIAPNAAEIIAALGAADRLVGVSDFCVYPPALSNLPRVGGIMDPDLERIATLDPDLIVLRGQFPTVESLCRQRGISIHHDRTESYEDIYASIHSIGELLNRADAADVLKKRMRDDVENISARLRNAPRPRVLLIVNREADSIRNVVTFGGGTFVDEVIRLAGGINVFADSPVPYPQVTVEQILAAQPNVIIEAVEETRMSDALRSNMLSQWKRLPAIPAVRDERIYIITEDYLLIPSPRVVDSTRLLARTLHGEVAVD